MNIYSLTVISGTLHNIRHCLNLFDIFHVGDVTANINYIAINKKTLEFYVQFKNDKRYLYSGVPVDKLEQFYMMGDDKSKAAAYYSNTIKGHSFIEVYDYFVEVADLGDVCEAYKKLLHHKDTTVGLFATDKPELIENKGRELMFEIRY
jgi:hypothetical protein